MINFKQSNFTKRYSGKIGGISQYGDFKYLMDDFLILISMFYFDSAAAREHKKSAAPPAQQKPSSGGGHRSRSPAHPRHPRIR